MTIIGPDRTGLVESVARVVAEHGGNWLESRMCRLGGEFAGILRIELPVEKRQPLLGALQALQGRGLTVVVRPDEPAAAATKGRQTKLEIVGHDRPGIVREITSALARANVNVEEFSSECRQRAHVRRNAVQGRRPVATARRLRPRRAEKGFGKNRRRSAGGHFVCGTRQPVSSPVAMETIEAISLEETCDLQADAG